MRVLVSARELLGCSFSQCSLLSSLYWSPTLTAFKEETRIFSRAVLGLTAVMEIVCLKCPVLRGEFMLSDTSILQSFEDSYIPALVLTISA